MDANEKNNLDNALLYLQKETAREAIPVAQSYVRDAEASLLLAAEKGDTHWAIKDLANERARLDLLLTNPHHRINVEEQYAKLVAEAEGQPYEPISIERYRELSFR